MRWKPGCLAFQWQKCSCAFFMCQRRKTSGGAGICSSGKIFEFWDLTFLKVILKSYCINQNIAQHTSEYTRFTYKQVVNQKNVRNILYRLPLSSKFNFCELSHFWSTHLPDHETTISPAKFLPGFKLFRRMIGKTIQGSVTTRPMPTISHAFSASIWPPSFPMLVPIGKFAKYIILIKGPMSVQLTDAKQGSR